MKRKVAISAQEMLRRILLPSEKAFQIQTFERDDKLICVIKKGMQPPKDGRKWTKESKSCYGTVIWSTPI